MNSKALRPKIIFRKRVIVILLLLVIALSLAWRLSLIKQPGHLGDFQTTFFWLDNLKGSWRDFYQKTGSNYGPLYQIVSRPISYPVRLLDERGFEPNSSRWVVLHSIMILVDVGLVALFYILVKKRYGALWGVACGALYIGNPILYFASGQWGQADNIIFGLLLLTIWFLIDKKYYLAIICLVLGIMFKPTPAVLVPLVGLILIIEKRWKEIIFAVLLFCFIAYTLSVPFFGFNPKLIAGFFWHSVLINNITPRFAVGAKSLWFLLGENRPDSDKILGLSAHLLGNFLFAFVTIAGAIYAKVCKNRYIAFNLVFFIVLFGFYFLPTRSHERYQLFSFLPLILLTVETKTRLWAITSYILSTFTFTLVILPLYWPALSNLIASQPSIYIVITWINLFIFVGAIIYMCYYFTHEKN